jgi:hypothetical protein
MIANAVSLAERGWIAPPMLFGFVLGAGVLAAVVLLPLLPGPWQGHTGAAAKLLNVLRTPAHHGFYMRACERVTRGEEGSSPQWARDLVARWTTLRYDAVVK